MRDWHMLIWMTQLGLSTALPLALWTICAVLLRQRFSLGVWIVIVGVVIGFVNAFYGLRASLRAMERMEAARRERNRDALSSGKKK